MCPDGQPTDLNAFHINQRDEGIDLHGVSGALMATTNMQMQTFVTQPDDTVEGFDGYNGDLTGDVAATLGANCGMSTGRNGVMAFATNQRDEVRDLHDVAGALNAQPGMKQQTFVAAAFSAGAGASAGSIGYGEELAPTLKGSASGNCMPSVLCLNDQGGSVMECSEDVSGTLRAQEHGHQPLVYENHGIDARYTGPHQVVPTMSARYGTGGNNVPLVEQEETFCITGNAMYYQSLYLQITKGYVRVKMECKDYILAQKTAIDALRFDPKDSELNMYAILTMGFQGNLSMAQTYYTAAKPYLALEHAEVIKKYLNMPRE